MLDTKGFEIILASGSPRRHDFFNKMQIPFTVKVIPVDEDFPENLNGVEIAQHIVRQKSEPFIKTILDKQLIITADTIVWHKNERSEICSRFQITSIPPISKPTTT